MSLFRIRYEKRGGHYHLRVFSATTRNTTYAKLGDLCLAEKEWLDFQACCPSFEFLPEEGLVQRPGKLEWQTPPPNAPSRDVGRQGADSNCRPDTMPTTKREQGRFG